MHYRSARLLRDKARELTQLLGTNGYVGILSHLDDVLGGAKKTRSSLGAAIGQLVTPKTGPWTRGMLHSAASVVDNTPRVAKVGKLEERLLAKTISEASFTQAARQEAFMIAAERTRDSANLMRARSLGHKINDPYMMKLHGGMDVAGGGGHAGIAEMTGIDAGIPVPAGHQRLYRGEGVRTPSRTGHGGEEHLSGAWYNSSLRSAYTYASQPSMTATHGGGIASAEMMTGFGHVRYVDVPTDIANKTQVLGKKLGEPGWEGSNTIGKNEYLLSGNLQARSRLIGEEGPGGVVPEPSEILHDPKALGQFRIRPREAELVPDPTVARVTANIANSMDVREARFTNAAGTKGGRALRHRRALEAKAKRLSDHLANGGRTRHRSAIDGVPIHRSSAPSTFRTSPGYDLGD